MRRLWRIPGRIAPPIIRRGTVEPVAPIIAATDELGAATLVLSLQDGARLTYGWATEIGTSHDGTEQRVSWQSVPSVRFEGTAYMTTEAAPTRAALMRSAARGATFSLALPFDEISVTADGSGATVITTPTKHSDWLQPGQRVAIVDTDDSVRHAVVQSSGDESVVIDAAMVVHAGARIMPVVPVLLESQQGFARHPFAVDTWDIRAIGLTRGWAGVDAMGRGVEVLTMDGVVPSDALTDDHVIIWDRANAVDGRASDSMVSRAELVDLGGVVFAAGGSNVPDWLRPIKLRSASREDLQWLRAVTHHIRGRQGAFLLSTGADDLPVYVVPGYGQLTVVGDYVTWFSSQAHRQIAVTTTDGDVQHVAVSGAVDNGDGTNTLSLLGGVYGPIGRVSLLEQVRLETDDVTIAWDGATHTTDLVAHVVQDTTTIGAILTTPHSGHGLDGDVTFPVGITTLTRDMHWETGRLQNGSIVRCNGYVPRFRTALIGPVSGLGIIEDNGADASGATGGAGALDESETSNPGSIAGGSGTGANGGTGSGTSPTPKTDTLWPINGRPGRGGAGGVGTSGAGGAAVDGAAIAPSNSGTLDDVGNAVRMRLQGLSRDSVTGGAGGASGGGNGTQAGGGGGGGARNVVVCAGQVVRPENVVIRARGGAGAAGIASGCGGGGGGGGGNVCVIVGRLPFPSVDVSGGAGGASGGGSGGVGSPGQGGTVYAFHG